MSTSYNTLTLGEEETRTARKPTAVYVVIGLAVVAFAGAAAFLVSGTGHVASVNDASFSAERGDEVICHENAHGFLDSLPKYDPTYTEDDNAFYNACYYSYRCCTTTGNSAHCQVSENFGLNCKDCIASNGPRMVRKICSDYLNKKDEFGNPWSKEVAHEELNSPQFDMEMMMEDTALPQPSFANLKLSFAQLQKKTCWPQAGPDDNRMKDYTDKCFEVLSWCNLLCPRDAGNSVQHNMCKHCTLFGFNAIKDTVEERAANEKNEIRVRREQALKEEDLKRATWAQKWIK